MIQWHKMAQFEKITIFLGKQWELSTGKIFLSGVDKWTGKNDDGEIKKKKWALFTNSYKDTKRHWVERQEKARRREL